MELEAQIVYLKGLLKKCTCGQKELLMGKPTNLWMKFKLFIKCSKCKQHYHTIAPEKLDETVK
jgi:hypothetical protein